MSLPALLSLWFWVSRPLLYPLLPLLFLLGVQAGGGVVADFGWLDVLFVWALTWPLSMIIYGINDIYDYDTDRLDATRTRLDGAALTPGRQGAVWRGVAVASFTLLTIGAIVYGWYGVGFAVTAIIVSVCYSVPPLRIKGRAPFDVLYSGFIHVCGMYSLGYWLMRPMTWPPLDIYILALAAVALHALGALRDYTADKASGNQTIAVRFGPRHTALFIMLVTMLGMSAWYLRRGFDLPTLALFASMCSPALLTLPRPHELLVRYSMWGIAVVALFVGVYKVLV